MIGAMGCVLSGSPMQAESHDVLSLLVPCCSPVEFSRVNAWALSRAGGARAPYAWRTAQPCITPRSPHPVSL